MFTLNSCTVMRLGLVKITIKIHKTKLKVRTIDIRRV